jgi:hypothetical protein
MVTRLRTSQAVGCDLLMRIFVLWLAITYQTWVRGGGPWRGTLIKLRGNSFSDFAEYNDQCEMQPRRGSGNNGILEQKWREIVDNACGRC